LCEIPSLNSLYHKCHATPLQVHRHACQHDTNARASADIALPESPPSPRSIRSLEPSHQHLILCHEPDKSAANYVGIHDGVRPPACCKPQPMISCAHKTDVTTGAVSIARTVGGRVPEPGDELVCQDPGRALRPRLRRVPVPAA
jgi:hypothetical protein